MTFEKQIAVAAGVIEYVRGLEALITEAMQRMYASHVEKTQMRFGAGKANSQSNTALSRPVGARRESGTEPFHKLQVRPWRSL